MKLTPDQKFAQAYGIRKADVLEYEARNGVEGVVRKYEFQMRRAGERGIEWLFDLRSWMEVWDGKIAKRGRGLRALCMCRHKDEGPYAPWNVRIATGYENKLDWWEKKPRWYKKQGKEPMDRPPTPVGGHHQGKRGLAMIELNTEFGLSAKRLYRRGLIDKMPD